MGEAYFYLDDLQAAIDELETSIERHPAFYPARRFLAAVYAEADRLADARTQIQEVLKLNPDTLLSIIEQTLPFKRRSDLERQSRALERAGLPR